VTPKEELEYLQLKKKKAMAGSGSSPMSGMFDAYKTPSTNPEIYGQTAGQVIGDLTGGPLLGMVLGGLGGTAGRMRGQLPRAIGEMLATKSIKTPATREIAKGLVPSFQRGATFSGLGELVPVGWEAAKAGGREIERGVGALTGAGRRVAQLQERFPLSTQLKVLKPRWLGGSSIPTPEVAGAAQGAMEKELGIPTTLEAAKERLFGLKRVPKTIREMLPSLSHAETGGTTASEAERLAKLLKEGMEEVAEKPRAITSRVVRALDEGIKPTINDSVSALRELAGIDSKTAIDHPDKALVGKYMNKIADRIGEEIPKYAAARKLTNLAHIYDEIQEILPRAPSGDPYRFGVMRLIWMLRTGMSFVTGGLLSPYTAGIGGVLGPMVSKTLDPVLTNRFLPAAVGAGVAKASQ
jgi:hypothetical protein